MTGGILDKRVALVTGGANGIGRSIAEKFASESAIVFVNDLPENNIDSWAADLSEKHSTKVIPLYFDITDYTEAKNAVLGIKKKYKKIDILVNNAGIVSYEFISMIDINKLKRMFDVNVYAVVNLIQITSRIMQKQKYGSIINMASIVGVNGVKGQLAYSASKGAVISITKSAAKELASENIRVNAVAPGMVGTERLINAMDQGFKDKINTIGMGRLAEPDEIADVCLFLASDHSSYISGQIIGVDGCTVM